jgi:ATP-dependent Clp protease ATP-binding subunit ClpA
MEEDILLYIDDMRNIVSLGNTEGSLDAANILKPYLSRSEIQVVGTCTTEEYAKYIEKDMSLNRLFQIVEVKEPTKEETYNIINGIKHKYEKHHNVIVNENVIKESIELGNRYIHTRRMPDKIIDILDEACAKAKTEKREDVLIEDVENVISKISNIPIQKIKKSEKEKLILLEKRLKENVIGQDEAIKKIANAIKRNRLGIRDTKRPMGVFLFTGPTRRWKNRVSKSSCK